MSKMNQQTVSYGILLILISICLAALGLASPMLLFLPFGAAFSALAYKVFSLMAILMLLAGVASVTGKLLCLSTQDTQARAILGVTLVVDLLATGLHYRGNGLARYLTVLSFLLFLAFLSRLATAEREPELARLASITVWSGVGMFLLLFFIAKTRALMLMGLPASAALLLVMALAAVPLLLYCSLLARLFLVLRD
jgi:hypothetical protein